MRDLPAIRFRQVEQRRPHFRLGPLTIDIPAGYVTAIVGPNGSGKTTTFRLLLELTKPDNGEIELLGHKLGPEDSFQLKQRIGYLPEESISVEDGQRGSDKAAFARLWHPGWDVNRYHELLRLFEVNPDLKLCKMSKGMRRKFDFALALSHHPELLLLDEPSSGLDPLAWKKMIDILHRFMEQGDRTILMASHIIDEVRRLADYIVFLAHGRVLGFYEKDELLSSWYMLYIRELDGAMDAVRSMPGYVEAEPLGGGIVKAVTNQGQHIDGWLEQSGVEITGRTRMELDDILSVLIRNDKHL